MKTFLSLLSAVTLAHGADEKVFFAFDDHSIPWQHNLKVTMVPATKHPGNPVLRRGPEGAPDHGHAVIYGTVIKDGGKFRMWYLGMFETELKSGSFTVYAFGSSESPSTFSPCTRLVRRFPLMTNTSGQVLAASPAWAVPAQGEAFAAVL